MMQLVGSTRLRESAYGGAIAAYHPHTVPVLHFIHSRVIAMNIIQSIGSAISYFFGGCIELFSPNHDDYPLTGVQPFEGETHSKGSSISGHKD